MCLAGRLGTHGTTQTAGRDLLAIGLRTDSTEGLNTVTVIAAVLLLKADQMRLDSNLTVTDLGIPCGENRLGAPRLSSTHQVAPEVAVSLAIFEAGDVDEVGYGQPEMIAENAGEKEI